MTNFHGGVYDFAVGGHIQLFAYYRKHSVSCMCDIITTLDIRPKVVCDIYVTDSQPLKLITPIINPLFTIALCW